MNPPTNQTPASARDGVAELLAKASQIRSRAERLLQEASAFDELKRLLGPTAQRSAPVRKK